MPVPNAVRFSVTLASLDIAGFNKLGQCPACNALRLVPIDPGPASRPEGTRRRRSVSATVLGPPRRRLSASSAGNFKLKRPQAHWQAGQPGLPGHQSEAAASSLRLSSGSDGQALAGPACSDSESPNDDDRAHQTQIMASTASSSRVHWLGLSQRRSPARPWTLPHPPLAPRYRD